MTSIESFLIEIDRIPWFANVGKPSDLDGQALRIMSWQAWPGPETPGSGLMQEAQVDRYERLLAAGDPPQIEALWQRIHDRVFMQAIPRVPWKDDADAWYGPSAAVWNVAWNAAPVGISGSLGLVSSKVVSVANGRWLQNGAGCAGHWPCMYFWQWGEASLAQAARYHAHEVRRLVVY